MLYTVYIYIAPTYDEWFVWVDKKSCVAYGNFYRFVCIEPINCSATTFSLSGVTDMPDANQEKKVRLCDVYKQSCHAILQVIVGRDRIYINRRYTIHCIHTHTPGFIFTVEKNWCTTKNLAHTTHTHTFRLIFLQLRRVYAHMKNLTHTVTFTGCVRLFFYSWEEIYAWMKYCE